jgi:hypothetical protein
MRSVLTLLATADTINRIQNILPYSPRRLARPRTSPFHGGNTGSNPVGDANVIDVVEEAPNHLSYHGVGRFKEQPFVAKRQSIRKERRR